MCRVSIPTIPPTRTVETSQRLPRSQFSLPCDFHCPTVQKFRLAVPASGVLTVELRRPRRLSHLFRIQHRPCCNAVWVQRRRLPLCSEWKLKSCCQTFNPKPASLVARGPVKTGTSPSRDNEAKLMPHHQSEDKRGTLPLVSRKLTVITNALIGRMPYPLIRPSSNHPAESGGAHPISASSI